MIAPADAQTVSADPSAAADAGAKSGADTFGSSDCLLLQDRSRPAVLVDAGPVVAEVAQELGCDVPDGGGVLLREDTIFHRSDGALLVKAGVKYALHWPALTVFTRVRLNGGSNTCPVTPVVDLSTGPLAPGGVTTCQDFSAAIDAKRLHFYGSMDVISLGQFDPDNPLIMMLCKGSCDPGTEFVPPSDAGLADAAASDAGVTSAYAIPPIPGLTP